MQCVRALVGHGLVSHIRGQTSLPQDAICEHPAPGDSVDFRTVEQAVATPTTAQKKFGREEPHHCMKMLEPSGQPIFLTIISTQRLISRSDEVWSGVMLSHNLQHRMWSRSFRVFNVLCRIRLSISRYTPLLLHTTALLVQPRTAPTHTSISIGYCMTPSWHC